MPMSVTDEIKERLDIVEVISSYVPLKKAGRNYKGLCPFHGEKTPSFVVFPDSQNWHCFGACATGGDVFSFVMKRENLDFGEALRLLADKAGVELQPRAISSTAEEQHLERLRAIVTDAAIYFHYLLNRAGEAEVARDYLEGRGLLPTTWEAWQLGYALDSWEALRDRLTGKGYTLDEVEEAGLIIRRDDGSGHYDRFRGRLMIPIRDVQGRTVGFGARLLREDANRPQPKYINSPQTPLFDKGATLYGLDMARKAIREEGLAVVVEGYMDVLMSHQVGVRNVVAGMGTALTEAHLQQIKRYTTNITLALDPDTAGDHATLRGLEAARQALDRVWEPVLSPTGLIRQESRLKAQLRIATLPEGLDPDELALNDPDRWRSVIAEARPIVDYYLAVVGQEEDLTTARGKANAVTRMAPLIGEIANSIERSHYIQLLARLVQTDERLVAQQVIRTGREGQRRTKRESELAGSEALRQDAQGSSSRSGETGALEPTTRRSVARATFGLEEHILGCLLSRPDLLGRLDEELIGEHVPPLSPEDFAGAENRAILVTLQASVPSEEDWTIEAILGDLPEMLRERCQTILEQAARNPTLTDEKLTKDMGDSLLRLRAQAIEQQITQIRFIMKDSQETGTPEWQQYKDLMLAYSAQLDQIQKLLYARTMAGALARARSSRQN
jgi:DNA primase